MLIILLCLIALLPTSIMAQEDHDIAATLNLNEVVVLADGMMSANVYDKFYEKVRDKAKELKKKYRKKQETDMKYMGSYTAGGRTIYKVRLANMHVHIVDGCWQIKMMDYSEGQNKAHFEFSEIRPGLFLLSKSNAQLYIDRKKWPNGYISMQMTYSYK